MKREVKLEQPLFLTPHELAERWSLTTMTIRRWRKAGKLKAMNLGRSVRFTMAEIERFETEAGLDKLANTSA